MSRVGSTCGVEPFNLWVPPSSPWAGSTRGVTVLQLGEKNNQSPPKKKMKKHVPRKKTCSPNWVLFGFSKYFFWWHQEASSQSNSSISSNQPGSLSSSDMVFSKSWPTLRRCWLSGSRCVERIRFTTPRPWRWESPSKRVSSSTFGSPNWTFLIQILPVEKKTNTNREENTTW